MFLCLKQQVFFRHKGLIDSSDWNRVIAHKNRCSKTQSGDYLQVSYSDTDSRGIQLIHVCLVIRILVALNEYSVFLRFNQGSVLVTKLLSVPQSRGNIGCAALRLLWVPSLPESSVTGAKALTSSPF